MCLVVSGSLQIININSFLNWQCPILYIPMQTSTHFSSTTPIHNSTSLLYHTLLELTLPQEYIKAHTSTDYYKNRVACALCLTPIMRMHCTVTAQSILQRTFVPYFAAN